MKDPHRLLTDDTATDFERLLLGAAARERPTELQRRRMHRAIGLSQIGLFLMSAKTLAGVAGQSVVMAVIAASLAGGSSTPKSASSASVSAPMTSISHSETRIHRAVDTSESQTTSEISEMPAERSVEAGVPVSKPVSGVRASGGTRRLPDLREEIALMDQARSALRSAAPTRALTVLQQYRGQFPQGSFGQEAAVLRIEALAASGNHAKAVAEANGFLSRNPNSPHSERLRRIVAAYR
jgi:hypothetical protein